MVDSEALEEEDELKTSVTEDSVYVDKSEMYSTPRLRMAMAITSSLPLESTSSSLSYSDRVKEV